MTNSPWIHVAVRVYEHNLVDSAPLSHVACHTRLPSSCNVLTRVATLDTSSASYPLTRLSTHRRHLCSQQEVLPNHRLCIVTLTSGASMPTRFNVPLHTCLPAKSTAAPARAKYNKRCRHPIVPRTSPTQHPSPLQPSQTSTPPILASHAWRTALLACRWTLLNEKTAAYAAGWVGGGRA